MSAPVHSTRSDPTRVTLLLDDGAKIPSRRELVVTNRASASSERGDFLSSESFRSIDVSEGVASVAEYEIITMISPPDGGVVKGRRRVAVYVAPAPVSAECAKNAANSCVRHQKLMFRGVRTGAGPGQDCQDAISGFSHHVGSTDKGDRSRGVRGGESTHA